MLLKETTKCSLFLVCGRGFGKIEPPVQHLKVVSRRRQARMWWHNRISGNLRDEQAGQQAKSLGRIRIRTEEESEEQSMPKNLKQVPGRVKEQKDRNS